MDTMNKVEQNPEQASPPSQALNRKQRRSQGKKGLPPVLPRPGYLMHQRLTSLEALVERLGQVADQNTSMFSESLKMLEVISVVQQRVTNDTLNGVVRCFGDVTAESGVPIRAATPASIDFASYMREYWLCMLMTDFAVWSSSLQKKTEPVLHEASAAHVIEFGG